MDKFHDFRFERSVGESSTSKDRAVLLGGRVEHVQEVGLELVIGILALEDLHVPLNTQLQLDD